MSHVCVKKKIGAREFCTLCLAESSKGNLMREQAFAKKLAEEKIDRNLKVSGIPDNYMNLGFDSFTIDHPSAARLVNSMRIYVDNFNKERYTRNGFIFTGLPGTGKTHIGCTIAFELIKKGFTAAYVSLPRLTHQIRSSYRSKDEMDTLEWIDFLSRMDLLIIDEIDLHGNSDSDYQFIYDLVNQRYNNPGHPTLAISNRSLEDLKKDLHERLVSRIIGNFGAVNFNWDGKR